MDRIQGHCPICRGEIVEESEICPKCLVPHCASCWEYSGGCSIYGCGYKIGEILVMNPTEIIPLWDSAYRLFNCAYCKTTNYTECHGSFGIHCRGCGHWMPRDSLEDAPLIITSDELPRTAENKEGILRSFGRQMLQTWKDSLCPTDPIVKVILFALFTLFVAPVWLLVVYMLVNIGGYLDVD